MNNNSDHDQFKAGFPGGENEEQVKKQMWAHIESATLLTAHKAAGKKSRSLKLAIYYSAAASIIMVVGVFVALQTNWLAKSTSIDNMSGNHIRTVRFGALQFTLQPGSECTINQSLINNSISLKFCGAVSVQNVSPLIREINVASGLFSCTVVVKDSVNLHKGQTYLAMTDQQYSMISATTDEIIDGLPRSFSSRLEKRFNL